MIPFDIFAKQIFIQIDSKREMYALEQSVYKCLAKLSFLRVFVNLASRRTEKKRTIQTRCESWKFRGKTREATLWGIAYPRGIRLVERVKGDWGPMEVQNANKLSIVFECDIMSRYSFSCGHKRKKNPRCGVAISSFIIKRSEARSSLDLSPSWRIYLKL